MFCRQCGVELKDGAQFCPQCGTPIEQAIQGVTQNVQGPILTEDGMASEANAAPQNQSSADSEEARERLNKKKNKSTQGKWDKRNIWLIIGSLLIAIITAVGDVHMDLLFIWLVIIVSIVSVLFATYKLSNKLDEIIIKRETDEALDRMVTAMVEETIAEREERQEKLKEQYDNGDTNIAYDFASDGTKFYYDIRQRQVK